MTAGERQIVAFTGVAHGLNHAVELVYGAILAVVAIEFGVTIAALGVLGTISSLAYAGGCFACRCNCRSIWL